MFGSGVPPIVFSAYCTMYIYSTVLVKGRGKLVPGCTVHLQCIVCCAVRVPTVLYFGERKRDASVRSIEERFN